MKQKQFTRTTQITGLALLSGVLVGAMLPSPAQAKPFPKKGYILQAKGVADIGRRASTLDAQRAALRMMVRMMKWAPKEDSYEVNWKTLSGKGKSQQDSAILINSENEKSLQSSQGYYMNTTKTVVCSLVRSGGAIGDLSRYGAVDIEHPIKINLNRRTSYDDGSQAVVQRLAKELMKHSAANYEIRWVYALPDGRIGDVLVSYTPLDGGYLDISRSTHYDKYNSNNYMAFYQRYSMVSKESVFRCAEKNGVIRKLEACGARLLIGGG